jgi:hypothetical protein
MFVAHRVPVVRSLPADRSFTKREGEIASALGRILSRGAQGYGDLRSLLSFLGEESVHAAFMDSLNALACTHEGCGCLLREKGDARDRVAMEAFQRRDEDELLPFARAFVRWCWHHWRGMARLANREVASSFEARTGGGGNIVANSLDHRSEHDGIHPSERGFALRCEESADGTRFDSVLEMILHRSGCSELEADAYVAADSRLKRTIGSRVDECERTAASRGRRKVKAYLASRGIYDREDLEVAIEEGEFRP